MRHLQTWFRLFFIPSSQTFSAERQRSPDPLTDGMLWLMGLTIFSFVVNMIANFTYRQITGESRLVVMDEMFADPMAPAFVAQSVKVPHQLSDGQTLWLMMLFFILFGLLYCWSIGSLVTMMLMFDGGLG